ncbi:hypothetical protein SAMN05421767_102112 [Granulicatella balaenopterae]|uniref:Uncharacterized protein n=1 Tax=Granulicatella balaenopterae TaxID=137733 RepID=A0A1H9HIK9_9LACT|nr:hypothetical protein [Granulicatella balaenopterae]SEQ62190.1 hypothetical protein SAMN05421767_102112 [Granulicatella balaenopterae]
MKKMLVTMVLVVGIVASLPTVEAATNEVEKIAHNEVIQYRNILEDLWCKIPGFCGKDL